MKELTKNEVEEFIKEGKSMVYFWATWCAPCKTMSPLIYKLAEDNGDKKIAKIDIEELAEGSFHYNIKSVPTIIFFENGSELNRINGYVEFDRVEYFMRGVLGW